MRFVLDCWDCFGEMVDNMSDGDHFNMNLLEGKVTSNFIVEYNCNKDIIILHITI